MVCNLRECGGPGKIRSYWEEKVHEVVAINEDSPVYSVKAEDGTGKVRVLHRNLLLPCDYLPLEEPPQPVTSKKSSHSKKKSHGTVIRDVEDESSDDEDSLPENFLPVMLTQGPLLNLNQQFFSPLMNLNQSMKLNYWNLR